MSKQPKKVLPPQHQTHQPGLEYLMNPRPVFDKPKMGKKLAGKTAIITGGDSGIGRAVSVLFAKEGANVVIVYFNEHIDAEETKTYVEREGARCKLIAGDIGDEAFSDEVVRQTKDTFPTIDILINNAAEQHPQNSIENISSRQLIRTFQTNMFSMFYLTKAVLPYLKPGSSIINTTSVTAYAGNETLIDYSATKGAITSFTRSLALSLVDQGIRVNGVAPGPIWTPLIPSTFTEKQVETFGSTVPMGRPGQPVEVAPSYLFLASEDSSYMTGQILHINGGKIING
ncbi:SDR family oxidoreductase [Bacillus sp. WMMC1349]|uniref:SDR family oxidoreductase n=1 Tax=Bacillus sp. WMMC1349 TaxID=2736254 RepID=UPI0015561CAD|nr:SDR family oxidoreductase [Bacillus sp. WMMC1349]NPC92110.1 SDR family oxidoreductase [Bacillus sp. WMMC1349]